MDWHGAGRSARACASPRLPRRKHDIPAGGRAHWDDGRRERHGARRRYRRTGVAASASGAGDRRGSSTPQQSRAGSRRCRQRRHAHHGAIDGRHVGGGGRRAPPRGCSLRRSWAAERAAPRGGSEGGATRRWLGRLHAAAEPPPSQALAHQREFEAAHRMRPGPRSGAHSCEVATPLRGAESLDAATIAPSAEHAARSRPAPRATRVPSDARGPISRRAAAPASSASRRRGADADASTLRRAAAAPSTKVRGPASVVWVERAALAGATPRAAVRASSKPRRKVSRRRRCSAKGTRAITATRGHDVDVHACPPRRRRLSLAARRSAAHEARAASESAGCDPGAEADGARGVRGAPRIERRDSESARIAMSRGAGRRSPRSGRRGELRWWRLGRRRRAGRRPGLAEEARSRLDARRWRCESAERRCRGPRRRRWSRTAPAAGVVGRAGRRRGVGGGSSRADGRLEARARSHSRRAARAQPSARHGYARPASPAWLPTAPPHAPRGALAREAAPRPTSPRGPSETAVDAARPRRRNRSARCAAGGAAEAARARSAAAGRRHRARSRRLPLASLAPSRARGGGGVGDARGTLEERVPRVGETIAWRPNEEGASPAGAPAARSCAGSRGAASTAGLHRWRRGARRGDGRGDRRGRARAPRPACWLGGGGGGERRRCVQLGGGATRAAHRSGADGRFSRPMRTRHPYSSTGTGCPNAEEERSTGGGGGGGAARRRSARRRPRTDEPRRSGLWEDAGHALARWRSARGAWPRGAGGRHRGWLPPTIHAASAVVPSAPICGAKGGGAEPLRAPAAARRAIRWSRSTCRSRAARGGGRRARRRGEDESGVLQAADAKPGRESRRRSEPPRGGGWRARAVAARRAAVRAWPRRRRGAQRARHRRGGRPIWREPRRGSSCRSWATAARRREPTPRSRPTPRPCVFPPAAARARSRSRGRASNGAGGGRATVSSGGSEAAALASAGTDATDAGRVAREREARRVRTSPHQARMDASQRRRPRRAPNRTAQRADDGDGAAQQRPATATATATAVRAAMAAARPRWRRRGGGTAAAGRGGGGVRRRETWLQSDSCGRWRRSS